MMVDIGTVSTLTVIFAVVNILAVMFAGTLGTPTIGEYVTFKIFDRQEFETGTVGGFEKGFDEGFDKELTEDSFFGIGTLLDGLKKIFSALVTILTLGFNIFFQLQMMGAPLGISIIIGLPMAIVFYLGILGAIRGFRI